MEYVLELTQAIFALALAPLVTGFVRWLKARMQNRQGAPPWQPYFELVKLLGKEVVVSKQASWLFHCAPYIAFVSTLAVTFLVPFVFVPQPFDRVGDLLAVVYLLLLGTFFLALAGLDPGTAFGGMGSSREMTVAAIAEPTIAVAIFSLALGAGSTNLGRIITQTLATPANAISPGHLLAFAALFIVALAETGRLPVDNPATHLELTMIHEAMILNTGPLSCAHRVGRIAQIYDFPIPARKPLSAVGRGNRYRASSTRCSGHRAPSKAGIAWRFNRRYRDACRQARLFRVPELLGVSFVLALLAVTSSFLLR